MFPKDPYGGGGYFRSCPKGQMMGAKTDISKEKLTGVIIQVLAAEGIRSLLDRKCFLCI